MHNAVVAAGVGGQIVETFGPRKNGQTLSPSKLIDGQIGGELFAKVGEMLGGQIVETFGPHKNGQTLIPSKLIDGQIGGEMFAMVGEMFAPKLTQSKELVMFGDGETITPSKLLEMFAPD